MFLPERYRRNPPWRRPSTEPPPDDADSTLEPDGDDDGLADDPDEDEQLTDEAFLKSLRADVLGVRDGTVPSMSDVIRPSLQDRPWSRRHKRRDRFGRAF